MSVVIVVTYVIGVSMIYLGGAATLCVVRDQSLTRRTAILRIMFSWFVPLLGHILTIKIAAEDSAQHLRSWWWLWPLRPMLAQEVSEPGFARVIDMRADAERILPGSTIIGPLKIVVVR
jgi:hypothetical protein